jgi:hypothetical protein
MVEVWGRIIGVFAVLILITFLAQWIVPRGKSKQTARRQYLRRDVSPMLGFFSILILGLSLAEALRREILMAWVWGIVLGIALSFSLWVIWNYNAIQSPAHRGLWYYIRRLGVPVVASVIAIYLAVRVFGVTVEVFVSSALGIALLTSAIFLFAKSSVTSNP